LNSYCIIVTGLPASGKTTIGREVASRLKIPFLDKDAYLEKLFDKCGIGDNAWRQQLSLQSNTLFQADAIVHQQVVLVSHWRPTSLSGPSGTPTDWLTPSFGKVIELFCDCPPEAAVQRFVARQRHAGHLDVHRNADEMSEWLDRYLVRLPIGIGQLIAVNSAEAPNFDHIIAEIVSFLDIADYDTFE
jgi:hypothetical protein